MNSFARCHKFLLTGVEDIHGSAPHPSFAPLLNFRSAPLRLLVPSVDAVPPGSTNDPNIYKYITWIVYCDLLPSPKFELLSADAIFEDLHGRGREALLIPPAVKDYSYLNRNWETLDHL